MIDMDPTLQQTAPNMAAVMVAVGGLVLALTQSTKRFTPEGWGPVIAAVWTTLALFVWAFSQPEWPPVRTALFDLLAVWVSVYVSALGLYSAATVPSNSRQQIGSSVAGDSNLPVGESNPPTREDIAAPHEHLDPPAPEHRAAPVPRGAVLTEPVVAVPRRPRGQYPEMID